MAKREVKSWITINGVHVPIFEGQTKEQAAKAAIERQKKRGPVSSDTRKKAVGDYVDKKRQYRDAYDKTEVFQRHHDRASNAEEREVANIKLKSAARDRDSKLQEFAKASDKVANLNKQKVRQSAEFKSKNTFENRKKLKDQIDAYVKAHPNPNAEDRNKVSAMRDRYNAMVKESAAKTKAKVNAELAEERKRDAQKKELEDLKREHYKLYKHDEDNIPDRDEKLNALEKKINALENGSGSTSSAKSSAPEFKSRQEAEEYYKNKFAGVSSTYANKMAKKMGIEGRGKDKREALAKAYADRWETSNNINKDQDLKEKQIAANAAEKPGSKEYAVDYMRSLHKDGDNPVLMKKGNEYKAVSSYEAAEAGKKHGWEIAQNELTDADKNHIKGAREERKGKTKVGETSGGTFNYKEMQAKLDRERAEKAAKEKALSDEANRTFKPASDDIKRMAQAETLKSLGINRDAAINEIRNRTGLSLEDAERRLGSMSADQIKKMLGKQNKTIPKKIPASQVTISDSQYRFSTGKAPKGYGNWAFYLGNSDEPVFFHGSYAEAKKKAIKEAANRGINKIRVGS